MISHIRDRYTSFHHAWRGVCEVFKYHHNFRIHLVLAVIALIAAFMLQFSRLEYAIVLFTITLGLTAEMINTSIESVTDLITKEWREDARIAKDVAAGMMLIVAIGATVVALLLYIPPIISAFFK